MSNVKIVLNKQGMREMLKSQGVHSAIREKAQQIANNCGEGYAASSTVGRERALAAVYAETPEAKRDNLENNTILKAVR